MHHFLRRLTGISAIALLSVVSGWAQSSQAAPEKKKQYKDQQEYTLYDSASKETDANKRLQTLNTWKDKYPDSDFKEERLKLFLDTYQKLGQAPKMIDTAKEILAIDPADISALYWITFLAPSSGGTGADALATASKAANGLLGAQKPATTKDEDWKTAKAGFDAAAYKTLGWVAMVQKNNADAEQNFKKSLQIDPKTGEVAYWLGMVLRARATDEKKPELQSEALFYFARAAAYDGPGALNPDGRKKVDDYLTKVYGQLQVATPTLVDLKALAKANPAPPADFTIKTTAELQAQSDEELKKTNPQFFLWKSVKESLSAANGAQYFSDSVKENELPGGAPVGDTKITKFKGWLVKANPDQRSKELLVSMEGKDKPADITLRLVGEDGKTAAPLTTKPVLGDQIEFEGQAVSFTANPGFMLTLNVQKTNITGLKEEKIAPVHHPVHKKSAS